MSAPQRAVAPSIKKLFGRRPAHVTRSGRVLEDLSPPPRLDPVVPEPETIIETTPAVEFISPAPIAPGTMLMGRPVADDEVVYRIADAIRIAAHVTSITRHDLLSQRRMGPIAKARQIGMWLARQYTLASLPMIGAAFGGRDHTTALHAIRRVEWVIADRKLSLADDPVAMAILLWSVGWPRAPK